MVRRSRNISLLRQILVWMIMIIFSTILNNITLDPSPIPTLNTQLRIILTNCQRKFSPNQTSWRTIIKQMKINKEIIPIRIKNRGNMIIINNKDIVSNIQIKDRRNLMMNIIKIVKVWNGRCMINSIVIIRVRVNIEYN